MENISNENHLNNLDYRQEKIFIRKHASAEELKTEIRNISEHYRGSGWNLIDISSKGAFLYLKFKQCLLKDK